MVALQTACEPPVVPTLRTRHVLHGKDGIERRFLAYDWVKGNTLETPLPRARVGEVARLFARLHSARVMDLWGRIPDGPTSLLDTYRKSVDDLRSWVAMREQDGLGQDLLTLSLSDLQRALRAAVVAQDNAFRTAKRRVLCHGDAEPSYVVAKSEHPMGQALTLVGLDRANLGDAAFDLAHFAIASELDVVAEDELITTYTDALHELGRSDPRFIIRYFACRSLSLLALPINRLEKIARIKRGTEPFLDDPIVALEREAQQTANEIARAMTGLKDLIGRARPTTATEVHAMGRIVALEDMVLAGRSFRLALSGEPYTGKTEVGALVARRLKHRFLGTAALSRALAVVEKDAKPKSLTPRALVKRLFERGFAMEPLTTPPFYRATFGDDDVTDILREADRDVVVRAGALLDDESVRQALKDELEKRDGYEGVIVEGLFADSILGSRAKAFHLTGDPGVRRARLVAHRIGHRSTRDESDSELDDDEAQALLARLDAEAPKPPPDAIPVDVGSRPAAAAALAVLVHLLPPSKRPSDLSNRKPL